MIRSNVIYQDNESAILLEANGKISSGEQTRHIEIRFFFVTDNVEKGTLSIEYCPTNDMVGDFFTKPLQGSNIIKFRSIILGVFDQEPIMTDRSADPVCKECVGDCGSGLGESCDKSESATSWIEVTRKKRKNRTDDLGTKKISDKQSEKA